MSDWLAHPLILLVAGAILSSFVIPGLTRRWQNHQKELELKTSLVTEITQALTSLVMAVQFAEMGSQSQTQEDFDEAYREWETSCAVIASKLRAYFPRASLVREWGDLARLTTNFYALTGMGERKEQFLQELLDDVRSGDTGLDADATAELERLANLGVSDYKLKWAELKAHVLARKDAVVRGVLETRSAISR